jgi:hypothetical protein
VEGVEIGASGLLKGTNVLALEVHRAGIPAGAMKRERDM